MERIKLLPLPDTVQDALTFAVQVHQIDQDQRRKGSGEPYIVHPIEVAQLIYAARTISTPDIARYANDDTVRAGLLHDTIEDSKDPNKISSAMIHERFGPNVGRMVDDVTEQDKSLPWAERKAAAEAHILYMQPDSLLVKTGDVTHNISGQIADYIAKGDVMFAVFKAPKAQQLARYQRIANVLEQTWPENPLWPTYQALVMQATELWSAKNA